MEIKINTQTITCTILILIGIYMNIHGFSKPWRDLNSNAFTIGCQIFIIIEGFIIVALICTGIVLAAIGELDLIPERTIKINLPKRKNNKEQAAKLLNEFGQACIKGDKRKEDHLYNELLNIGYWD